MLSEQVYWLSSILLIEVNYKCSEIYSGVYSLLLIRLRFAPLISKRLTMAGREFRTAMCRGVWPSESRSFMIT